MDSATNHSADNGANRQWRLPSSCGALIQELFAGSRAERWHLSFQAFQASLTRSAAKRFGEAAPNANLIEEYFATLHIDDLALACACAEGSESAWNEFVAVYRNYLRAAAAAILRRPADDPAAVELADSLFADLYGLSEGKAGGRSLFRYFHGRSSLKTWLRAVLAQRHVDTVRAGKKFDSLDGGDQDGETRRAPELASVDAPADPYRAVYLQKFSEALGLALAALEPRDRSRLRLYYAQECTLAEIGRNLGEHESSVSRNLERIRKELRSTVEGILRAGQLSDGGPAARGLDQAQIELCIQYAGEDCPIDVDKLFKAGGEKNVPGKKNI
jgi:RNA polymerase sigma-70 factor